jgi:hypothetical protein
MHQASGKPFTSIAFCNHGPATSDTVEWIMTSDLSLDASPDVTSVTPPRNGKRKTGEPADDLGEELASHSGSLCVCCVGQRAGHGILFICSIKAASSK